MDNIWHGQITLDLLQGLNPGTLSETLGIEVTDIGSDYIKATMPVDQRTKQPFGLLHGGASVALAETLGSIATWCLVDRNKFIGVGVEINANHLQKVTEGKVTGICKPVKTGGRMHVWEIKIYNDLSELCCISRFTCMVVPKR